MKYYNLKIEEISITELVSHIRLKASSSDGCYTYANKDAYNEQMKYLYEGCAAGAPLGGCYYSLACNSVLILDVPPVTI